MTRQLKPPDERKCNQMVGWQCALAPHEQYLVQRYNKRRTHGVLRLQAITNCF